MKYFIFLFLIIFGTGCDLESGTNGTKEVKIEKNEILKVALPYKARSFDPHINKDSATLAVTSQIYDTLFYLDDKGDLHPDLAESYEVLSDSDIILHIRKDVYFHNGDRLTSADVANSLIKTMESPVSKVIVSSIISVKDIGDDKVEIIHSCTPSMLLRHLSHASTAITKNIPSFRSGEEDLTIVGTGPFKMEKWGNGENIRLASFDKYFDGASKIKELYFETIPESSGRYIALETGEIDIAYDLLASDIKLANKNQKVNTIVRPSLGIDFVTINTHKITDKRVRQAIELGINKRDISAAVFEDMAKIAPSILPPNVFGYDKDAAIKEYAPKRARELLKEAGYGNGLKLTVYIYDEPSRSQMAQVIQGDLKNIGVDLSIETLEVSSFLQRTANGEHDMLIGLWHMSTGDADFGFYPLLHSSSIGAPGNRSFYSNPEVDELLDNARKEQDNDKRADDYKKVQKIISDDVPLFPISYKTYMIGISKNVDGFIFSPSGNHVLYKVIKR